MLLSGGDCCSGILLPGVPVVLLAEKMGFANSTEDIVYSSSSFVAVKKTSLTDLVVTLTGFTPGNAILIGYSIGGVDGVVSGVSGISYEAVATVDIHGGGQKQIEPNVGNDFRSNSPDGVLNSLAMQWNTFYQPAAIDVTQAPRIGLVIRSTGTDPTAVPAGSALLWVAEFSAAIVTQSPTTTLAP